MYLHLTEFTGTGLRREVIRRAEVGCCYIALLVVTIATADLNEFESWFAKRIDFFCMESPSLPAGYRLTPIT